MSKEAKTKQKKYKELIEKMKKRIRKEKLHLTKYDNEDRSDKSANTELHFRLYCHIVGYGDQMQKWICEDKII